MLPDYNGAKALQREFAAKQALRAVEGRMTARQTRSVEATALPPPRPRPPPGPSPRLGFDYTNWHGHCSTWAGAYWVPAGTTPGLLDLIDRVVHDRSLSGRGGRLSPLSVSLVDGLAY
jgi:hypothetical protein